MQIIETIKSNPIGWLLGTIVAVLVFLGTVWGLFFKDKNLTDIWNEGGLLAVILRGSVCLILFFIVSVSVSQIPAIRKLAASPNGKKPMIIILVALLGAGASIFLWCVIAPLSTGAKPADSDLGKPKEAVSPSVRVKYSSRHVIESNLGDPEQVINLDNIATLRLWSCGPDVVEFLLTASGGSTSVKSPVAGQGYKTGGDMEIVFPSSNAIVNNSMTVVGPAKEVRFDLNKRTKRITVNERVFRVHMDHISDESSGSTKAFKYVFLISEE